jgi:hypothetical protein
MPDLGRQPALHELVTCLRAPTTTLSGRDGQLRGEGAHGVYVADLRVISVALLTIDDVEPEATVAAQLGPDAAEFVGVVWSANAPTPDPAVWVRRMRRAESSGCNERLLLSSALDHPLGLHLRLRIGTDLAGIGSVRAGRDMPLRRWRLEPEGAVLDARVWVVATAAESVSDARSAAPGTGSTQRQVGECRLDLAEDSTMLELAWSVQVPAHSEVALGWSVTSADPAAVVGAPDGLPGLSAPVVTAGDRRIAPLIATAVGDLDALRMTATRAPDDVFIAAGSPWYLTLFGRDSLWAARMLLPLGTAMASGTLRTLAAFQGTALDPMIGEEPGKILHELRRSDDGDAPLPPIYYGTVDATPLWVCLLAEAWRFGLDPEVVSALVPTAERALAWMVDHGDADGDGFLEYIDQSGRGLTNQGWKDSSDAVRFADGRIADGPVALAEVQGYAHEAALAGADLLDAFGRPGADRWRNYAEEIAARFRDRFWVSDDLGAYPAMALDGDKRPVDAPASNMAHLLGTGMLTTDESALIANRLTHSSMSSGFGLRTMATTAAGYSPLSYHCGSVWPHDTAIGIHGLLREGLGGPAGRLADGLLAAGAAFGGRLPELYGGFAAADVPVPVPYPAACRPQGWSAAAAIVMLRAFLGLEPDVPGGTVTLRPTTALGALEVTGLRIGEAELQVEMDGSGVVHAHSGGDLRIVV